MGSEADHRRWKVRRAKDRERLDKLKDAPCMDCGHKFPPECMDFDHVRGEKLFEINTSGIGHTQATVLKEIAKCDLVCANCHRIRTAEQRKNGAWTSPGRPRKPLPGLDVL